MWGAQLGFQMERNGQRTKERELTSCFITSTFHHCFFSEGLKGGGISSYQSREVRPLLGVATVANLVWPVRSSRSRLMLVPTTVPPAPPPLGCFRSF